MKNKGLLFVVSGPSGVGKGTICQEYVKTHDDSVLSISATTRAPREGEKHGVNYYYITNEEFEAGIAKGEFLENAVFCGNRYGTPKKAVLEMLESGKNVILEIEVQGAMQVRSHYPEGVFVFVIPPSLKELENRLRGRNTETDDVIKKRLERAKQEFALCEKYNYILMNDNLGDALSKLEAIMKAERCYMPRNIEFIKKEFC
ncbi:MAG: guanylate kinase [Clostridia bacterium]|nr:guanylate kinase [Clostridia bacterium]